MRVPMIVLAGLVAGCGGGDEEPGPAGIAAAPVAPGETREPAPPPAGTAAPAEAAAFPELPDAVRFVRVTQGGWRVHRAGAFEWQRGLSAQVRFRTPYRIRNVELRLPTGRLVASHIEEVRGDDEQVVDGSWGLNDADWGALQRDRRVDLALPLDHSAIAARVKSHANVRKLEVQKEGQKIPIGQGQELEVRWQDWENTRVLAFHVDALDPALPVVLCLTSHGLGSGDRAEAERISGGDLFSFGDASEWRAIYVQVDNGWTQARGNKAPPAADATSHELGWVVPKPHIDQTKPIVLRIAVLRLPLILLRGLPVGW